jgi:mRNA-degrading endonuclease RelE of RelBE toxin-antitoxin system
MVWEVHVKEEAIRHLEWFGKSTGRQLLRKALQLLRRNPLAESKNMKPLRSNPIAERELRLFGKYRVLYSVHEETKRVTIILVGEKKGNRLLVLGKEFSDHHEGNSTQ